MTDVVHDPATDWCACEPGAVVRCDYRHLADEVIRCLNPPDGDEAEVMICIAAVRRIAVFVSSLICSCSRIEYDEPCPRCSVLGQRKMKAVPR